MVPVAGGNAQKGLILGFDLGNSKSVVARSTAGAQVGKADLVINEMSNRATPTLVSFHGSERSVGEKAQGQLGVNPQNTINNLMLLLGKTMEEMEAAPDEHMRYSLTADENGFAVAEVTYKGAGLKLLPEQMIAMLLAQLVKHAQAGQLEVPVAHAALCVPPAYSSQQVARLYAAGKIAGLASMSVIPSSDAAISCYNVQHPLPEGADSKNIMLLDIGHAFTCCTIYSVAAGAPPTKLACASTCNNAGYQLDSAISAEFQAQCEGNGVTVSPKSRQGYRLFVECEKVKRTLSTVPDAFTVLECVGDDDRDLKLTLSRSKFEDISSNQQASLSAMLTDVLSQAGLSTGDIAAVELAGGTSRVPWVKKTVATLFGSESILSTMLDSSSCFALGAAFIVEAAELESTLSEGFKDPAAVEKLRAGIIRVPALQSCCLAAEASASWPDEALAAAVALEGAMQQQDAEEAAKADARNALESFILSTRSSVSEGKHGGALREETVGPMLEEAEDWMYGDGEDAELAVYQSYLKQLDEKVRAACPAWYEAEEAEKQRKEAEMKAEAEAAKAEAEGQEKEDHDFRKLAKPERMRLVNLNKSEANELYKGGNVTPAIQRWAKALQHTGKFFDLTDDDKKEVDALKLSLHLNLSMGYLKLAEEETAKVSKDAAEQLLRKVQEHCTDAIKLDAGCVKALFRRASAMEKLGYLDEAHKDSQAALDLEPDDKMIIKLCERVKTARAKRLEKEKQFAKKMFG